MHGHEVRRCSNGIEGLRMLRQRHPDVVILDVDMPQLSGPEMVARMSAEGAGLERIPIVLASGVADLASVAARVGTPYALEKPFDPERLVALVQRALDERAPPRIAAPLAPSDAPSATHSRARL